MLHLLKRHPIPIAAHFEWVLVLTYAFPREILAPLLPPGLELDVHEDLGFLAVATVQTRKLRPAFLPPAMGRDFFLTGYRIFTRLRTSKGRVLRGLKILRSDADRTWMVNWGNRLTRYGYCKADVAVSKRGGVLHIDVATPGAEADLKVRANLAEMPGPLPEQSPFASVQAARRFAGPLPHTFDYESETGSIVVVRGVRGNWRPEPVSVSVERNSFLSSARFSGTKPVLANAFYLSDVPYRWERGWLEPPVEP